MLICVYTRPPFRFAQHYHVDTYFPGQSFDKVLRTFTFYMSATCSSQHTRGFFSRFALFMVMVLFVCVRVFLWRQ